MVNEIILLVLIAIYPYLLLLIVPKMSQNSVNDYRFNKINCDNIS